ncbi:hypothetical protein C8R41DRAFT_809174 [Lentinula lateritia]|uniref:Uncharacterized protein n=1 Tax=Lentinula lateritia TaxID=40482 RepID=A0ABQ8VX04_9AGAR|nr:hypothetical protein C8R41DRAFT_809174 [Lentinula lateritia]
MEYTRKHNYLRRSYITHSEIYTAGYMNFCAVFRFLQFDFNCVWWIYTTRRSRPVDSGKYRSPSLLDLSPIRKLYSICYFQQALSSLYVVFAFEMSRKKAHQMIVVGFHGSPDLSPLTQNRIVDTE